MTRLFRNKAVVVLAVVVGTSACGGGGPARPPATLRNVVDGPATRWSSIVISAGGRAVQLSGALRDGVAPLVAARVIAPPPPDADTGLDHPLAVLRYAVAGQTAVAVDIGGPNFDSHGYYVRREGSPTVYLVLADPVRRLLAAVGVTTPPPA